VYLRQSTLPSGRKVDISNTVDAPRVTTLTVRAVAGNPTNTLRVVMSSIVHGGPGIEMVYVRG